MDIYNSNGSGMVVINVNREELTRVFHDFNWLVAMSNDAKLDCEQENLERFERLECLLHLLSDFVIK
jgi:hypothetical protein